MKIIFTSGYHSDDDEITKTKGHRSDVLLLDNSGNFYELNFVTLERLQSDLNYNLDLGKKYFTDVCLIILQNVTRTEITSCVKELSSFDYFKRFTPLENIEIKKDWVVFSI